MSFLQISLGNYYPAESVIHELDPRLKIISLAVMMIVTFSLSDPAAVGVHTVIVLGAVLVSGVPLAVFYRGLRLFVFLFFFTAVLHLFFTPGEAVFQIHTPLTITVTREGIARGGLISWRLLAVIVLSSLLTYTTSPLSITRALETLLSPLSRLRFPVQDFSLMLMMAIRFIPVLTNETEKVWKAQKSRGADLRKGGLKVRSATLMSIILPVFTGLFRRADELAVALESRGYVPGKPRSAMYPLEWKKTDTLALLAVFLWVGTVMGLGFR
jgi:energy-coupling factor transport system permease protein